MADLSKIKLNGTEYDLKDAVARESIPTKTSELTNDNGFLSGDSGYSDAGSGFIVYRKQNNLFTGLSRALSVFSDSTQVRQTLRIGISNENDGVRGNISLSNAGSNKGFTTIDPGATSSITITLPSSEGTLALTSQIPNVPAWALTEDKPTYTASEVGATTTSDVNSAIATAIGNINQFEVAIVTDLPTTNIDTHTIYFKSNSLSGNNVYDEYMYINNNWELIGSTQIDLTPYALSANLATVATSGDYDDLIDAPVAESDTNVETMLNNFNLDYTNNTSSPNYAAGVNF